MNQKIQKRGAPNFLCEIFETKPFEMHFDEVAAQAQ
jgi:hypothetical protein